MAVNAEKYKALLKELDGRATLVAVSKTKLVEDIRALYELGQRDFGENYVQELVEKQALLPADIRWHFIGHLQTNKVKYIAPFVHLVQGVDSEKLLLGIDRQAQKCGRVIPCLLQVHIAREETKFGFDETELEALVATLPQRVQNGELQNVKVAGLMGMASFTDNTAQIRQEFNDLKRLFDRFSGSGLPFSVLSMGMSSDYALAIAAGSNLVRVGSLLFGARS